MTLTITGKLIRSPDTAHTAELAGQGDAAGWRVSWLPQRLMDKNAAVAAMMIADEVGRIPADCDPEVYDEAFWSRIDALAGELGMSGPAAVSRASESPEDAAAEAGEEPG